MCQSQNFVEAEALAKALTLEKMCCYCHFVRVLLSLDKFFLQSMQTALLTFLLLILK